MSYHDFYQNSLKNLEAFWSEQSKSVQWFSPPQEVLSQDDKGLYRWFKGGKLNTSYLALDVHVENGRGDQVAMYYDSPVTQQKEKYTYSALLSLVEQFAGVLKKQGISKGDRVLIYMPMIPQVVVAMLASARLGAVHSVVFGGFAANELAIRINDAKPKVIVTASGGIEVQRIIPFKPVIDQALAEAQHQPQACIVYQRPFVEAEMKDGFDVDWNVVMEDAEPETYVEVDSVDPLYILYTSGTTGQPKGIIRDNGGHAVAMQYSMKYVYGAQPGEVYWAASDVGWVVGHSYIVYAPLMYGCSTILFEGKPIKTPDASTFWRVLDEYKVRTFFTAPTAFRAIKKEDPEGKMKQSFDTSPLRYLFLAGERTDISTLHWCEELLQVPVIDHWWQTESGYPMLAQMAGVGLDEIKPGSAGRPVAGYDIRILDEEGQELPANQEGAVCVRYPLPPGCLPTLWEDDDRFVSSYLSAYPGYYFSGDGGYKDEDGYIFITGRMDDVINVSGHRLSTAQMEEVVAQHPAVAECCVVGIQNQLKGQIPMGFFIVKDGVQDSEAEIEKELVQMVRAKIGAIACFKQAVLVQRLPKTRSGKILRKIIRAIVDQVPYNPPSTIEDMSVLDEIAEVVEARR